MVIMAVPAASHVRMAEIGEVLLLSSSANGTVATGLLTRRPLGFVHASVTFPPRAAPREIILFVAAAGLSSDEVGRLRRVYWGWDGGATGVWSRAGRVRAFIVCVCSPEVRSYIDKGCTVTHLTPAMGQLLTANAVTHMPALFCS